MKKFVFLFFVCLMFLSSKVYANNIYAFVWENTYIIVEQDTSIYEYLYKPTVKLYCNNECVAQTPTYTYSYVDLNVVDTSKIAVYTIEYTATCLGIEDYCNITFKVEAKADLEKPNISLLSDIIIGVNSELDYDSFFHFSDNVTETSKLEIKYSNTVLNNLIGTYTLDVSCIDEAGNVGEGSFDVLIVDNYPPTIEQTADVVLNYGDTFYPSQFFNITDNYDTLYSLEIDYSNVDLTNLGYSEGIIFVSDSSGNVTSKKFNYEVVDNESPVVSLTQTSISVDISDPYKTADFYLDLIEVTDNFNDNCSILVDSSNVVAYLGTYKVYYTISDGTNETIKELYVHVVSSSTPQIICSDIYIEVGESVDYSSYISVFDSIDGNILDYTIDDSLVNINSEGVYTIYITAYNSLGNYTQKTVNVNVSSQDSILPILVIGLIGGVIYFVVKKRKA